MMTIVNDTLVYSKVAKRVDLEGSHYKKKIVTVCDDEC